MKNQHTKDTCNLAISFLDLSPDRLVDLEHRKNDISFIELRADAIKDEAAIIKLKNQLNIPSIYSLRSQSAGGLFSGTQAERIQRLSKAALSHDLVDLEGERDLIPELLEVIPVRQRMITWSGKASSIAALKEQLAAYTKVGASFYRFILEADKAADGLLPLLFLKEIDRKDVLAYAESRAGQWSQIIAPYLGAPMAFGKPDSEGIDRALFTMSKLFEDYRLPDLPVFDSLYGIAGNPVFKSRSPKMHNNAYKAIGLSALYLPFQIHDFEDFWKRLVKNPAVEKLGFSFQGFTVVSPFKKEAIQFAETARTPIIQKAQACNVLTKESGTWELASTDLIGVKRALVALNLKASGLKVAIIGCGGAGRTMAAGLQQNGAEVLLVNRSFARAHRAAELLALPFCLLEDFSPKGFDLIINATPLGKHQGEIPFDVKDLELQTSIIDLTYSKSITDLVNYAVQQGNAEISGRKILLFQVLEQFKLLTGQEMPYLLACRLAGVEEELQFLKEIKNRNGIEARRYFTV